MGTFIPDEDDIVTVCLDDGTEMDCAVIAVFPAGERDYVALLPLEDQDAEEGEVFLYRFSVNGENEDDIQLDNIESDEEFEIVSDAFDELLDSEESTNYLTKSKRVPMIKKRGFPEKHMYKLLPGNPLSYVFFNYERLSIKYRAASEIGTLLLYPTMSCRGGRISRV